MNSRISLLFLALILGSFSDEAVQIIFFLKLSNIEKIYLMSLLFLGGMSGGILASIFFSRLLSFISFKSVLIGSLILQGLIILSVALIRNDIAYLVIAFILGFLGSLLWSAVLVAIPALTSCFNQLESVNKYAHAIRNMGYFVGPTIGGFLFKWAELNYAVLIIGSITLFSALIFLFVLRNVKLEDRQSESTPYLNGIRAIHYLFQNPIIKKALSPIIFTVMLTSASTTLLVVYLTNIIKLNGEQYGIYSSMISLSLALSPVFLISLFKKWGEAQGTALAAVLIGVGQLLTSMNENYLILCVLGVVIGSANGVHNALLSALMLKNIAPAQRKNQLPAYGLILQSCAATGFIISLFVQAEMMHAILIVFGLLTIAIGLFGVWLNRTSR